jgi:hypothetical protein
VHCQALLAELLANGTADGAEAVKQRAAARFKAGNHAAAADAYRILATWSGAAASDLAAASSNLALCLLHQGQHLASLEACDAVLKHELGCCWNDSKDAVGAESAASRALEADRAVLTKTFARIAANFMHLRKYGDAAAAYKTAAVLATSLGIDKHANDLNADALQAERLAHGQDARCELTRLHEMGTDKLSAQATSSADQIQE